jgi:hypothetical protein
MKVFYKRENTCKLFSNFLLAFPNLSTEQGSVSDLWNKYSFILMSVSINDIRCVVLITMLEINNRASHDSSVGIALGYGLDDRGSRFRFPAGAGNVSLDHRVQNGSGTYPAS